MHDPHNMSILARPPTESLMYPLLTPPTNQKSTTVVSRIIDQIDGLRTGHYSMREPWLAFQLDSSEYKDLQELIREDGFVQDKVRYVNNITSP
jgi:hypothetical protein